MLLLHSSDNDGLVEVTPTFDRTEFQVVNKPILHFIVDSIKVLAKRRP